MPKILVIEDNEDVLALLNTVLILRDFEVLEALNGTHGIELARTRLPDLIILDLMLPDMDGIKVCQTIRKDSRTKDIPIIILTARTTVLERVKGLETGANDYLTKPFDTLELLARVRVQLREKGIAAENRRLIRIGDFEIDPSSYRVRGDGKEIRNLTPKEFDVLYVLMKHSPKPISREDIFQIIWGKTEKSYSRVIDIHIAKIRKKIKPQNIKTIPGKGYLFPTR